MFSNPTCFDWLSEKLNKSDNMDKFIEYIINKNGFFKTKLVHDKLDLSGKLELTEKNSLTVMFRYALSRFFEIQETRAIDFNNQKYFEQLDKIILPNLRQNLFNYFLTLDLFVNYFVVRSKAQIMGEIQKHADEIIQNFQSFKKFLDIINKCLQKLQKPSQNIDLNRYKTFIDKLIASEKQFHVIQVQLIPGVDIIKKNIEDIKKFPQNDKMSKTLAEVKHSLQIFDQNIKALTETQHPRHKTSPPVI